MTQQPKDCIFCKIVTGLLPSSKIYEDDNVLVVLDLFPITKGQTIVIAKKHLDSNFSDINPEYLARFTVTAQQIAKKLEKALNVKRVAFVIEGAQIPHLHAKLYPYPNLNPDGTGEFALTKSGEMGDRGELDLLAGVVGRV